MPQYPNANVILANIVQEMVGKAVKITATQCAPIEVKEPRILNGLLNPEVEFREKVVAKPARHFQVFT